MSNLTCSEARKGEVVTTVDRLGGIGTGYLIDGQVWATTGSYWAVKAENDVFGLAEYHRDNGRGYLSKIREVMG